MLKLATFIIIRFSTYSFVDTAISIPLESEHRDRRPLALLLFCPLLAVKEMAGNPLRGDDWTRTSRSPLRMVLREGGGFCFHEVLIDKIVWNLKTF